MGVKACSSSTVKPRALKKPKKSGKQVAMAPAPWSSPQEAAERRELREQVAAGLEQLTPEHRQVLVLREIHQLSYDEIAQVLSLDVGSVKSRISRGRRQLRKILVESGNFSAVAASKDTGKEGCT